MLTWRCMQKLKRDWNMWVLDRVRRWTLCKWYDIRCCISMNIYGLSLENRLVIILQLILVSILVTCFKCLTGGIFIVGGKTNSAQKANETEFIDTASSIKRCDQPSKFPPPHQRYGMVGTYIGDTKTLFCGGYSDDVPDSFTECWRYQCL